MMMMRPRKRTRKNSNENSFGHDDHNWMDNNIHVTKINENEILILIEENENKIIEGMGSIRCLYGSLEIHGSILTPKSPCCQFYSFYHHGLFNLKSLPNDGEKSLKSMLGVLKDLAVDPVIIKDVKTNLRSKLASVALISKITTPFHYLKNYGKFKYLYEPADVNIYDENKKAFIFHDKYQQTCQQWENLVKEGKSPILILCGGKNTGKSTLARYLVNKTLNVREKVAFMECDVGQTELIPPGCLGLNLVTQPMLGPPYCHQENPEIMCFVGLTNVSLNPVNYFECVKLIYDVYINEYNKYPLIINTMGWNRGLGVSLFVETVKLVRPTMLVQLESQNVRDNYPLMSKEFVIDLPDQYYPFQSSPSNPLNYSHHLLQTSFNNNSSYSDKMTAADFRSLSLLSYFTNNNNNNKIINVKDKFSIDRLSPVLDMPVYTVSFKDVALHTCHTEVPSHLIPSVFSASLCSLCTVEEDLITEDNFEDLPKTLNRTPVCKSLGLGIVHSISIATKTLNIATNVTSLVLEDVNCLLHGAVELPKILFDFSENTRPIGMPYLDYPLDTFGVCSLKPKGECVPRHRPSSSM